MIWYTHVRILELSKKEIKFSEVRKNKKYSPP